MKSLKDRYTHLLPAFSHKNWSEDEAEEFIGKVLDSYIEDAKFYKNEINEILISHSLLKRGMRKEEKIEALKKLLRE
jgi:hypothetical protein